MKHLFTFLLSVSLPASALAADPAPAPTAPGKTLVEWTFDRPGDLQGWQPNADLKDVTVTNGVLSARAVGSDPILVLNAPLAWPASPWQGIEVRLKADRDGECEVFWSNTPQGRFGGFTQEKTTRFNVRGDGQWRTYRVLPFWHPEGQIVRLRLDVYDGATFALDSLRLLELAMPAAVTNANFDFAQGAQAWRPIGPGSLTPGPNGLQASFQGAEDFLLAPPVRINADEDTFLTVRMAAGKGDHGTILFATEDRHGLHRLTFPITADAGEHTYNVDLLGVPDWRGRVVALGFRPSDASAAARVRWLKVSPEPQGAPQLEVVSFAVAEALPRAGLPATLTALLANTGGQTATNVQCQITLPAGAKVVATHPPASATLAFDERLEWSWQIEIPSPLIGTATVRVSAGNAPPVEAPTALAFTARPNVAQADYVPEPKPVRGATEVGVYYFPGWNRWSQWQPIQDFPERKPVLGWYREGDPAVADWQIKWAVEHGITFFAYDWYWSQGARQLEHGLHDAFFKARYRHLLKFCLLWANHNPPRSSSPEDCLAVTRYWIANYFRRPEHLMLDGKPVVIIFSTDRLTSDLGSANVKRAFEAMRAECRQAGLAGLYLIACVGNAGQARQAAEEGYDAVTAYNWPGLGLASGEKRGPFDTLLEGYRRNWQHILEQAPIPLLLPVCGGWDSRPWHGDNNLVRYGRTPDLFKRHLLDAKALLQTNRPSPVANAILIEAWNEWGEGSYLEPHKEFGFGYLDAIRQVFTEAPREHTDLAPADVGLGPYELPRDPGFQTAWDFDRGDEGWGATMQMTDVRATAGVLAARTTGNDPAFFGPPMQARASDFSAVIVRMKLQPADGQPFTDMAQFFWRTSRLPESEASSIRFNVTGDGQWHDYRLPVAENRRWRGVVTRLRLDPGARPGVRVELDAIRPAR
jgi:uncharacterized repeat protein (TIGR01451 family)